MKRVLVALMIVALFGMTAFAQAVTTTVTPTVTQTVETTVTPVCDEATRFTEVAETAPAYDGIKFSPLLGFAIVPSTGWPVGLNVGFTTYDFTLEAWTPNLNTPAGFWTVAAMWTPQIEQFGYRIGAKVYLNYFGAIVYRGFGFVMGVSNTWGPLQLYADLNVAPFGVAIVWPTVGLNILFSELIHDKK